VGLVRARNLSFCLEELNGEQALSIGVADYLADEGAVLDRALQLAGKLAALPQPAVASTKRFFSNYTMQQAETMDFEANRVFAENCSHPAALATLSKQRG
jgi:enoyl-CoA hydratase/carnithine racemase